MAERRMFTQRIIDSDAFLDMPLSTQALYFHLNMRADDDGFVNNPKRIQRTIGASQDDLLLLIAKRFVIGFDSGVIVIKHWRMHNTLRKDRYNPTQYQDELAMLDIKENNAYTEKPNGNQLATIRQPNGNRLEPQYSIGKDSIDKGSIDYYADSDEPATTPPPEKKRKVKHKYGEYQNVLLTDEELEKLKSEYPDWESRIERLSSYVASTGKTYKSHYATIRNWAKKDQETKPQQTPQKRQGTGYAPSYDIEAFEEMLLKQENPPPTAGDTPAIRERMEAVKSRLNAK